MTKQREGPLIQEFFDQNSLWSSQHTLLGFLDPNLDLESDKQAIVYEKLKEFCSANWRSKEPLRAGFKNPTWLLVYFVTLARNMNLLLDLCGTYDDVERAFYEIFDPKKTKDSKKAVSNVSALNRMHNIGRNMGFEIVD